MNKTLWFAIGVVVGWLGISPLMHAAYIVAIVVLAWKAFGS
jgi:hypothetical protein